MASRESFEEPQNNFAPDAENKASGAALPIDSLKTPNREGISDAIRNGLRDECARTALALTAFFDGEAGEGEALLVRSHLEECVRCVCLHESWTQQREMLHNLTVPVPPGLLTRLLTAIRLLSAFPQHRARLAVETTRLEPKTVMRRDVDVLSQTLFASGANPFAPRRQAQRGAAKIEAPRELPPLDPLSPPPPPHLRDEILRRTVGATRADTKTSEATLPAVAVVSEDAIAYEPQQRSVRQRRTRFSLYSTSLVPALAAWLMLLSGHASFWAPSSDSDLPKQDNTSAPRLLSRMVSQDKNGSVAVKPRTAQSNSALQRGMVTRDITHNIVDGDAATSNVGLNPEAVTRSVVNHRLKASEVLVAPQLQAGGVANAEENVPMPAGFQTPKVKGAFLVSGHLVAPSSSTVAVTQPSPPQVAKRGVARTMSSAALPKERPVASLSLPKVTAVPHRAEVTEEEAEMRTRRASWNAPVSTVSTARRVKWAVADAPVAAPQIEGENAEAEAETETLEHVNRLNDGRPEDVRHVLDEFRASLLANAEEELPLSDTQS